MPHPQAQRQVYQAFVASGEELIKKGLHLLSKDVGAREKVQPTGPVSLGVCSCDPPPQR